MAGPCYAKSEILENILVHSRYTVMIRIMGGYTEKTAIRAQLPVPLIGLGVNCTESQLQPVIFIILCSKWCCSVHHSDYYLREGPNSENYIWILV